jgi:hypothetical protein
VSFLDEIIDRVAEACGADFAFVLSRRGRLVTQNAPKDMPEQGRAELASLAEELLEGKRSGVVHRSMARRELVPYGGAAPVDVFVSARPEAILCVVMATYEPQHKVGIAMSQALVELDAFLEMEATRRGARRARTTRVPPARKSEQGAIAQTQARSTKVPPAPKSERGTRPPPARKSSPGGRRSVPPPPGRNTIPFLETTPKRKITPPPMPPVITVSEASIGRHTLAAIELDAEGPEITLGEAAIGRATMAEIELSDVPRGDPRSSLPSIRVGLATMPEIDRTELDITDRQTLPFVESPSELLRSFEARARETGAGASVQIRDPHPEGPTTVPVSTGRTVLMGSSSKPRPRPTPNRVTLLGVEPRELARTRDSNVEAWRSALEELVDEESADAPAEQPQVTPSPPRSKKR